MAQGRTSPPASGNREWSASCTTRHLVATMLRNLAGREPVWRTQPSEKTRAECGIEATTLELVDKVGMTPPQWQPETLADEVTRSSAAPVSTCAARAALL
jgi:hypothetical protein